MEKDKNKHVLPKLEEISSDEIEGNNKGPSSQGYREKKVSKKKINPKKNLSNNSDVRNAIKREDESKLEDYKESDKIIDNGQKELYNKDVSNEGENANVSSSVPIDEEIDDYNEMMSDDTEVKDPNETTAEDSEDKDESLENQEGIEDDSQDELSEDSDNEDNPDEESAKEQESFSNNDSDPEGLINNEKDRLFSNKGDDKNNKADKDNGIETEDIKPSLEDAEALKDRILSKAPNPIRDSKTIEMAKSVKDKSLAIGKAFTLIVKTLINPFFWVGIGIFILISAILSTTSVVGKNDYNEICDTEGFGGVNISSDADDFTRQSAIASWLASTPFEVNGGQPMNREQVSAIMGNLIHESAGANPKQIQGERGGAKLWETCDNDCILSWGGSGKAIGIAQWMGGRRMNLANLAKSEGKQWYELDVQLKLLQQEFNGTSESDAGYRKGVMERSGWNDTQTLEDYTYIFQRKFEGAMEARDSREHQLRETAAKEFHSKFSGSGGASSGLASNCIGGGLINIDASNVANLAIQAAWPTRDQGNFSPTCGGNPGCGKAQAKPEYLEIRKMAVEQTGGGGVNELYASCDMFVATVVRASGLDTEYPWTNSDSQINHMRNSPNWQEISCQDRQPGDVIWTKGHIMMYVGDVNGKDSIASASLGHRVGTISGTSCNGTKFNGDGRVAQGWRKVN